MQSIYAWLFLSNLMLVNYLPMSTFVKAYTMNDLKSLLLSPASVTQCLLGARREFLLLAGGYHILSVFRRIITQIFLYTALFYKKSHFRLQYFTSFSTCKLQYFTNIDTCRLRHFT